MKRQRWEEVKGVFMSFESFQQRKRNEAYDGLMVSFAKGPRTEEQR